MGVMPSPPPYHPSPAPNQPIIIQSPLPCHQGAPHRPNPTSEFINPNRKGKRNYRQRNHAVSFLQKEGEKEEN